MSIVDMNNELRQLKLKNRRNRKNIKWVISLSWRSSDDIISNQEILGKIDFICKGKLSLQMRGIEPRLNEEKY